MEIKLSLVVPHRFHTTNSLSYAISQLYLSRYILILSKLRTKIVTGMPTIALPGFMAVFGVIHWLSRRQMRDIYGQFWVSSDLCR